MKYISLVLAGCALMTSATACNNSTGNSETATTTTDSNKIAPQAETRQVAAPMSDVGFIKSDDGLEYKVVTKGTGTVSPKVGDIGEMNIKFSIGDTVMINSYEMNNHLPVTQEIQPPSTKGDLMSGLTKMKAGDSMVFRILLDTLAARANQPKPNWAKPGDYAVWEIKMVSVKTKAQAKADADKKDGAQKTADDKILQAYFKAKGIKNLKKTASGIYYTVKTPGTGMPPKAGQKVTVNYTGQTLKAVKFDSNVDPTFGHVEPFSFDLDKGGVIKGWDQALEVMKKGMKATFYIPSPLAYGANSPSPKIGANEILIFDIELLSFK
jgi:FKBP-type peptidyl-prolyl cis-trans isomerase FkpA